MGFHEKLGLPVGGKDLLPEIIPEACPVLERPDPEWELEGTLWKTGVLHRESVPGTKRPVEVMATMVEETPDPKSDEDPIRK